MRYHPLLVLTSIFWVCSYDAITVWVSFTNTIWRRIIRKFTDLWPTRCRIRTVIFFSFWSGHYAFTVRTATDSFPLWPIATTTICLPAVLNVWTVFSIWPRSAFTIWSITTTASIESFWGVLQPNSGIHVRWSYKFQHLNSSANVPVITADHADGSCCSSGHSPAR